MFSRYEIGAETDIVLPDDEAKLINRRENVVTLLNYKQTIE